ncbi:copper homeostasis periplasmic binding protein CopC [Xanthobacter sp. 126]|uniref:copper homeostasis periplasmic binding protein CopC n=1 Tax=Xanthobacter sp. 126 TaxID=1131814 RepID=UPI00045E9849|nr:copper homeostasis periplasmic binding protein CopC [Xanthobacter sp. 126]
MKRIATLFAAAALGLMSATAAFAHAHLEKAVPGVGATVSAGPSEVRLVFSEAVEPRFSSIVVTRADGSAVASGAAADASDPKALVLKLGAALPAGAYKVQWKIVSVDTHKTEGSFGFQVGK